MKQSAPPETIDEYIAGFPPKTQRLLKALRKTIRAGAPDAEEAIKYGMPTFVQNGNLVHFAAFKGHIGLYPAPAAISAYQNQLLDYKTSKGAIRFPIDSPLPLDLVKEIVRYRIKALSGTKK